MVSGLCCLCSPRREIAQIIIGCGLELKNLLITQRWSLSSSVSPTQIIWNCYDHQTADWIQYIQEVFWITFLLCKQIAKSTNSNWYSLDRWGGYLKGANRIQQRRNRERLKQQIDLVIPTMYRIVVLFSCLSSANNYLHSCLILLLTQRDYDPDTLLLLLLLNNLKGVASPPSGFRTNKVIFSHR